MRVIFAGSSFFGIPALQLLMNKDFPLLIISQPDKAAGRDLRTRPCPLAEFARSHHLDLFQPEDVNATDSLARIREFAPDLLITASYGAMIRRELRKTPRRGAINLHPSLLPRYRGATPIQSALLNGENLTGATIFRLNARLDAGPILGQRELPIDPGDDHGSLQEKLADLSARLLNGLLPSLEEGSNPGMPQDDSAASYTRKLGKADLILDWNLPARAVLNRVRAFSPQPGAQTFLRGQSLKVLAARLIPEPALGAPGSVAVITKNAGIEVNCRDQRLLLTRVQAAGKKIMDAWAWQLGARLLPGDSFGQPQFSQPHNPLREEK